MCCSGCRLGCGLSLHILCVPGVKETQELVNEMVKLVRDSVGPVAAFRRLLFVRELPKTRSGKIPRSSLARLVNGKSYKVRLESGH